MTLILAMPPRYQHNVPILWKVLSHDNLLVVTQQPKFLYFTGNLPAMGRGWVIIKDIFTLHAGIIIIHVDVHVHADCLGAS